MKPDPEQRRIQAAMALKQVVARYREQQHQQRQDQQSPAPTEAK
jgi:hypothetical protein